MNEQHAHRPLIPDHPDEQARLAEDEHAGLGSAKAIAEAEAIPCWVPGGTALDAPPEGCANPEVPVTELEAPDEIPVTELDVATDVENDVPAATDTAVDEPGAPVDRPGASEASAPVEPDARPAPEPASHLDGLLDQIRHTLAAERENLTRQAWAEADAWAAEQVAAEVERVRGEAETRLATETARLESEAAQGRSEDAARAESAIAGAVAERVEQAVADAAARQAADREQYQAGIDAMAEARIRAALDEAEARHTADVSRIKAQAEELLAQRFYVGLDGSGAAASAPPPRADPAGRDPAERVELARREERQAVLDEIDRFRRTMSRLDDASSLDEILETLGHALASEVTRIAIIRVADDRATVQQTSGFAAPPAAAVTLDAEQPGVIARVVEQGIPSFAQPRGDGTWDVELTAPPPDAVVLAVPLLAAGRVVAVVYADDEGAGDAPRTWPEVVGVLTSHASRCLDALRARGDAQGGATTTGVKAIEPRPAAAGERRSSGRTAVADLPWLGEVEIKPGHDASLVNLSDGGALVEAGSRLAPGTNVLLHFLGPDGQRVRGQVLRCAVYSFDDRQAVRYRGAVQFSEPLSAFFERAAETDATLAPVAGTVDLAPCDPAPKAFADPG